MNRDIAVVADNIRSSHNVGSLLRTCEGLGINNIYLTGYTPYPSVKNDQRLPYLANKITNRIVKTSLGAELSVNWKFEKNFKNVIDKLKKQNYQIVAVELSKNANKLSDFKMPDKVAFIFGNERTGIEKKHLELTDKAVFIPMLGNKESFNVVQAAAMVLYAARYV
jgi:tRNA G18 (ribose-2'-O)-methylase SpoU